jgi:hypothetical protein
MIGEPFISLVTFILGKKMNTVTDSKLNTKDYVVADISLSSFGRKEIAIAETEMPGLMAIRKEYASKKTFKRGSNFWFSPYDYPNGCFN